MKKMFIVVLLAFVVFSAYAQSGVIRELTGDVELKHAGSSVFVPAQVGASVSQETIVSTGFRSTAIIAIGSTTITVSPLTRLSLAQISTSAGTENLNVNLDAGRIRVEVTPPAGTRANTTIQSPSATASVRGTVFEMDTQNLNVVEGRVVFGGSDGLPVVVLGGSSSTVTNEGGAQDPVEIAAAELAPSSPVGSGESGEQTGAPPPSPEGDVGLVVDW